jgi:hypothetical protein
MLAALNDRIRLRDTPGVFQMKLSPIALTTALLLCLPAGVALAQAPATGNDTPAQPAPAASPSPAAPAPAASPSPAPAATPSASAPSADSSGKKSASAKKRKSGAKMTRQQEIDHSIESGTVPSRYRRQIPKEYQQYIPFDKQ